MKLNKVYTTLVLILLFLITGCSKDMSVEKVDINYIKNKQEIVFDSIYNVNYIIKNPHEKSYNVLFSIELDDNESYGLGEFYINEEEFSTSDDILITLNFNKDEESEYIINIGSSIIRNKEVIDKQIVTKSFDYFKNQDIYITESKLIDDNFINNKIHIANVNSNSKIYLEIFEN